MYGETLDWSYRLGTLPLSIIRQRSYIYRLARIEVLWSIKPGHGNCFIFNFLSDDTQMIRIYWEAMAPEHDSLAYSG